MAGWRLTIVAVLSSLLLAQAAASAASIVFIKGGNGIACLGDPANLPIDECNLPLTNFQSARVSFSPDGQSLAYGSPAGVYLLSLAGWPSCQNFTYKLIIPGGSSPYFGPPNVPSSGAPVASCTVPSLRAKTLQGARMSLTRHHCRLGRVKTKKTAGKAGRVLSQSPSAGRTPPNGSKVSVTVSGSR
jgi:hypothetical protein